MDKIPDALLRALASRTASRLCDHALLLAHPADIQELLSQCAKGRKGSYVLRHMAGFAGIKQIQITPRNLTASVYFDGPARILGMTLILNQAIPETITQGLARQPLREIIDHPFMDGLKIDKVTSHDRHVAINLKSKTKNRTLGQILAGHPQAEDQGWRSPASRMAGA